MLIGRDEVLESLEHVLADAEERSGSALIVRGEAGIGKSAIIEDVRARADVRGMRTLVTTGVPSEANLPFAGLHQLIQPLLGQLDALPVPQRDALDAAFGRSDTAMPDLFRIALATLELLTDAAAERPLLLIAENAMWLDAPTLDVLGFIARRLRSDPIMLLLAGRDGDGDALSRSDVPEILLGPLDDASSRALLDAHAPELSPEGRERVLAEAAGNPLALIELPKAVAPASMGATRIPNLLPLTARLERSFVSRAADLPSETRTLLLVAAADESLVLDDVLRAGELVGVSRSPAAGLAPAIAAGLINIDDARIRFRHPLMRSAVYEAAGVQERLRIHEALASVLEGDRDRSVWHRAAATVGHDDEVASSLEEAAERAQKRGATMVAVAALERAATLHREGARRASLLVRAAELAAYLGRRAQVDALLRQAERSGLGAPERSRAMIAEEILGTTRLDDVARTRELAVRAEQALLEDEEQLARTLVTWASTRCVWGNHPLEVSAAVLRVVNRVQAPVGDPWLLGQLAYVGRADRRAAVAKQLANQTRATADVETARYLGSAALLLGDFDAACGFLSAAANGYRTQARLGMLPRVLVVGAWAAAFIGRWDLARSQNDEGMRLAAETGAELWLTTGLAVDAIVQALHGSPEEAESLAAQAISDATQLGARFVIALAQLARGLAAMARGRPDDAYALFRSIVDPSTPYSHQVVRFWAIGSFAEAALNADRIEEARQLIAGLEAEAARIPSTITEVGLSFAHAVLADDDQAEQRFQDALAGDLSHWPSQRARLLLAYGRWLRRRRRRVDSRVPLRAARDAFDALGATPWGDRAREELRASGETSRTRTPLARDQLTPQELQIAHMAAQGLTNREIGRQLFLSHRTVGSHLYRIYPKLGVTSRTDLQAALDATH
jgi:DNA-binding CsgD family transcriptional regulator/tetratricopeptide (TPR) repeat protein